MIESCSSPEYSQWELELGKDFFFSNPAGMSNHTTKPPIIHNSNNEPDDQL